MRRLGGSFDTLGIGFCKTGLCAAMFRFLDLTLEHRCQSIQLVVLLSWKPAMIWTNPFCSIPPVCDQVSYTQYASVGNQHQQQHKTRERHPNVVLFRCPIASMLARWTLCRTPIPHNSREETSLLVWASPTTPSNYSNPPRPTPPLRPPRLRPRINTTHTILP